MSFDFGTVDHYSPRGFGFVGRTFRPGSNVFFHIKTVKHDAPTLAETLEGGAWRSLSFWYESEAADRGEQVVHVWSQAAELPAERREALVPLIERLWKTPGTRLSEALRREAEALLGSAAFQALQAARERAAAPPGPPPAPKAGPPRRPARPAPPATGAPPARPKHPAAPPRPAAPAPPPARPAAGSGYFYDKLREAGEQRRLEPIEIKVVGVTFENRQAVVAKLQVGEQVWLVREPDNIHDQNAICVERATGEKIGYVDRGRASIWAPQVEAVGWRLPAVVTAIVGGTFAGSSLGVRIRFTLPVVPSGRLPSVDELDEDWEL